MQEVGFIKKKNIYILTGMAQPTGSEARKELYMVTDGHVSHPLQYVAALLVVVCGYMSLTVAGDVCFLPSCQRCLDAGCGWHGTGCTWANQGRANVITEI